LLLDIVHTPRRPEGFRAATADDARYQATKNRSGPLFTLPVKYEPELFRLSAVEQSE
jgi:hypothetical protein